MSENEPKEQKTKIVAPDTPALDMNTKTRVFPISVNVQRANILAMRTEAATGTIEDVKFQVCVNVFGGDLFISFEDDDEDWLLPVGEFVQAAYRARMRHAAGEPVSEGVEPHVGERLLAEARAALVQIESHHAGMAWDSDVVEVALKRVIALVESARVVDGEGE